MSKSFWNVRYCQQNLERFAQSLPRSPFQVCKAISLQHHVEDGEMVGGIERNLEESPLGLNDGKGKIFEELRPAGPELRVCRARLLLTF